MIDKISYIQCCLCKSCADKCPVSAILFEKEINGFLYPVIDTERCIHCEACETVCPVLKVRNEMEGEFPKAYAARSQSREVRMNSTSGGLFFEAAKYVISNGGYVCGTVLDEHFKVKHVISDSIAEVEKMRGSKYAQSDTTGIYSQIQNLLLKEKQVVYSGCPCQAAALKAFLGKDYDNLIIIDFVCHGIPSQKMLNDYLESLEKRYSSRIHTVYFRSKVMGWHSSSVWVMFENGKIYTNPITVDPYMKAFLSGTSMKESCYSCSFKSFTSGSDITLGDFWGAETVLPEFDDNTGISAMFVNSARGERLVENLQVDLLEVNKDDIIVYNRNIIVPSQKNELRDAFLEAASVSGFGNAITEYFTESLQDRLQRKLFFSLRSVYYRITGKNKPLY